MIQRHRAGVNFAVGTSWVKQVMNHHQEEKPQTTPDRSPLVGPFIRAPCRAGIVGAKSSRANKSSAQLDQSQEYLKLGSKDLESSEPDFSAGHETERESGRQVNTEAVLTYFRNTTIKRKDMAKENDIESNTRSSSSFNCPPSSAS